MYVKDINGQRLRLTATRLEEIRGSEFTYQPWYLILKDLREATLRFESPYVRIRMTKRARTRVRGVHATELQWNLRWLQRMKRAGFSQSFDLYYQRRIGCRYFSKEEFAKILKAAKIPVSQ
jgi:hypothetical protein